jgi:hypothetical protein
VARRAWAAAAIILLAGGCKFTGVADQDAGLPVGLGFQFGSSLTDERVGTHTVSIAVDPPPSETVTVEVEVSGGSADDNDFSLINPTVTFLAGETRQDVELAINDDGVEELDETIELQLRGATNALIVKGSHDVTISANILPRIQFVDTSSANPEDAAGVRSFAISMDVASAIDVVIGYGVAGTASSADHDLVANTLTVPAGAITATLDVNITPDVFDEYDETLDTTLTAQAGAVLGANATHIHTIIDEDPEPVVAFDLASSNGGENAGGTPLAVSITPQSGKQVTVDYAVIGGSAGSEYAVSSGPLVFDPGVITRYVTVTPSDDGIDEEIETVVVQLDTPSNASIGGTDIHTFGIIDDDASPTLALSSGSSTPLETAGTYNLTVTKSAASERVVTFTVTSVDGTAGGADYSVPGGPYTIPIGMLSVTVPVTITGDNLDESNETFRLDLANLVAATAGSPASHDATITDDDVSASFTTADMSVNEGNGASGPDIYQYDVTLNAISAQTVTINVGVTGTADATDGSVTPAVLTYTPGQTVRSITVSVNRDNTTEGDDTFVMTLTTGAFVQIVNPSVRTHTILNND